MNISLIFKFNSTLYNYYEIEIVNNDLDYKSAIKFILEENHNLCGSFYRELIKLGNQPQILFSNFDYLNNLWCKENDLSFALNELILKNQITAFNPNILYCGSYFELFDTLLPDLKKEIGCKIYTWIACPLPKELNLKAIDKIFTSLPSYQKIFSGKGIQTEETIVGFDNTLTFNTEKKYNLGFIGGINGIFLGGKYHTYRTELLKFLSKRTVIHKWGYGYLTGNTIKDLLKKAVNGKPLYQNYHGEIWGNKMLETLSFFNIGLNIHAEVAGDFAVNNRIFETTGVGTFLLTDHKKFISDFFIPNRDLVLFKNKKDCYEKIKYYLKNEDEREEISQNGKKITIENYSVASYCKKMSTII